MDDLRNTTIETYNKSAKELSDYFQGIGPRTKYIEMAFEAIDYSIENPKFIEIGCGDGRDAKEIVKKTKNYTGFDISSEMVKLARTHVPASQFEVADAVSFEYPPDTDVVFAFASILHLDKPELVIVLKKVAKSLRPGGIFYISSKYRPEFTKEIKKDKFGERLFYFYNAELVMSLAGGDYEIVKTWNEKHGRTDWFELILKRI